MLPCFRSRLVLSSVATWTRRQLQEAAERLYCPNQPTVARVIDGYHNGCIAIIVPTSILDFHYVLFMYWENRKQTHIGYMYCFIEQNPKQRCLPTAGEKRHCWKCIKWCQTMDTNSDGEERASPEHQNEPAHHLPPAGALCGPGWSSWNNKRVSTVVTETFVFVAEIAVT